MISDYKGLTPVEMRHIIREGRFTEPTSGLCPGYAQANLIVLRKEHAYDFLLFAQRNPKSCPVLEVLDTGSRFTKFVAEDCDIAKISPDTGSMKKASAPENTQMSNSSGAMISWAF